MTPELDTPLISAKRAKTLLFYGGMVALAVVAFLGIRSLGAGLTAPAGQSLRAPTAGQSIDTLFNALRALAVILVTTRCVGLVFRRIGQPSVIGEVVGGILLGP